VIYSQAHVIESQVFRIKNTPKSSSWLRDLVNEIEVEHLGVNLDIVLLSTRFPMHPNLATA